MGCEARWLRPGESTRAERRTGSGVFHVIEGRGESRVGDTVLTWEPGDCFAVPPWQWIEHRERIRRLARRALPPQRRARAPLAGAVAGRDTRLTRAQLRRVTASAPPPSSTCASVAPTSTSTYS